MNTGEVTNTGNTGKIIYDGKIRENSDTRIPGAHGPLCTRPSAHTRTVSEESLTAWCLEDLLPLIHMTADLRVANDSLHLNHPMREQ